MEAPQRASQGRPSRGARRCAGVLGLALGLGVSKGALLRRCVRVGENPAPTLFLSPTLTPNQAPSEAGAATATGEISSGGPAAAARLALQSGMGFDRR